MQNKIKRGKNKTEKSFRKKKIIQKIDYIERGLEATGLVETRYIHVKS